MVIQNSGVQMPGGHQEPPPQPELQIPVPTHVPAPPATSSPRVRGRAGTRVARSPTDVPGFGAMGRKKAVSLDLMV